MADMSEYGATLLRLILGLLFLLPGIDKLMGMLGEGHMIAMMVGTFLAWIVLLSEIIFGIAVLIGWKTRYTVWPLAIILLVATFMVVVPGRAENPMWMINMFFHLLGVAALASVSFTGPGAIAVDKE